RLKPAPDMLLDICHRLGAEPARTAVVGDSAVDLAMARAAGAGRVIGVLSGVSRRADLEALAAAVLPSVAYLAPEPAG
ncbi:MAG TPA: HAD hydrolase-like protein, partial [Candidatus Limnocylindrales bacterium]